MSESKDNVPTPKWAVEHVSRLKFVLPSSSHDTKSEIMTNNINNDDDNNDDSSSSSSSSSNHYNNRDASSKMKVNRVGLAADLLMSRHAPLKDSLIWQAERPERLIDTVSELENSGLAQLCIPIGQANTSKSLSARRARVEELCLVHTADYVEEMLKLDFSRDHNNDGDGTDNKGQNNSDSDDPINNKNNNNKNNKDADCDHIAQLASAANSFNTIFLNSTSVDCARIACGSILQAVDQCLAPPSPPPSSSPSHDVNDNDDQTVDAVTNNNSNNNNTNNNSNNNNHHNHNSHTLPLDHACCVVRPPGHHAESHCAMGFSIFNSVAIAAKYAVRNYNLSRVLIVDWDVHHGNGTSRAFEDCKEVLYFSVHKWDFGVFYPGIIAPGVGADMGSAENVGTGDGEGYTVNVAWRGEPPYGAPSMGNAEYKACWEQVLLPIAKEYRPELILVSAGFDAARGDHLGECDITPIGYSYLTKQLMGISKVILALEGGYNVPSIKYCLGACVGTLLGLEPEYDDDSSFGRPNRLGQVSIDATLAAHGPIWPCLSSSA